jgi:hypothetical protein
MLIRDCLHVAPFHAIMQELIRRQQEIDTARRVLKDDDPDMPTKM